MLKEHFHYPHEKWYTTNNRDSKSRDAQKSSAPCVDCLEAHVRMCRIWCDTKLQ